MYWHRMLGLMWLCWVLTVCVFWLKHSDWSGPYYPKKKHRYLHETFRVWQFGSIFPQPCWCRTIDGLQWYFVSRLGLCQVNVDTEMSRPSSLSMTGFGTLIHLATKPRCKPDVSFRRRRVVFADRAAYQTDGGDFGRAVLRPTIRTR